MLGKDRYMEEFKTDNNIGEQFQQHLNEQLNFFSSDGSSMMGQHAQTPYTPMGAITEDNREDFEDDLQPVPDQVDRDQLEVGKMDE